jgi:hypothetical protein
MQTRDVAVAPGAGRPRQGRVKGTAGVTVAADRGW